MGRTKDDHLLSGADVAGDIAFAGVDRDFPALLTQGVAHGFEGLAGHVEEGHGLGQKVLHPRIELGGAPRAEVKQGERLFRCANEFLDGPGVELERLGEAPIPATTGVVDEALSGRLAEIDVQGR